MNNASYLTAGQFAELCDTTKDTLRHYNELGLLQPTTESEHHYNYYSLSQLYTYDIIKTLTDIGCPLTEIRDHLQSNSDSVFLTYLKETEQDLERRRSRLIHSIMLYEHNITFSEAFANGLFHKPSVITQKEKEILLCTHVDDSLPDDLPSSSAKVLAKHKVLCDKLNIYPFPCGHLMNKESFMEGNPKRTHVYTHVPNSNEISPCYLIKSAGNYLVIIHNGAYKTLPNTYRIFFEYIREHNLTVCSDLYVLNVSYHILGYEDEQNYYYVSILVK